MSDKSRNESCNKIEKKLKGRMFKKFTKKESMSSSGFPKVSPSQKAQLPVAVEIPTVTNARPLAVVVGSILCEEEDSDDECETLIDIMSRLNARLC